MNGRQAWTNPRLRAAWARGDLPAALREYRRLTGLSQLHVGEAVGLTQGVVSLIERGRRQVTSAAVRDRIAEGLKVPEELGGPAARTAVATEWDVPTELRARLATAHAAGRADLRTAVWIERVLSSHRQAEDEVGGQDLWPVVRSQLDSVTSLLPLASGAAADRLLVLAAEHAHWLSWVAADRGQTGAALSWLDLAGGWAADAGHADLTSWVLRVRSYYQLRHTDPVRALRTAEAARTVPGMQSAGAHAIAAHAVGMAAAAAGDRDRARAAADAVREHADRMASDQQPGWLYWLDPVRARLAVGDIAYAARDWPTASAALRGALPGLTGYPRDHTYYAGLLADAERRG